MSHQFIVNAIRDIVPTLEEPYPKEIIDYTNSLYSLSKVKGSLDSQFELARYHLCCYLTIEKFAERLQLPEPSSSKIPIPSRKIRSTVVNFRRSLLARPQQLDTPPSTPRKRRRRRQLDTPESTGKHPSRRGTPSKLNPYATPESTPSRNGVINLDSKEFATPSKAKNIREQLLAAAQEPKEASPSPSLSPSGKKRRRTTQKPTISTAMVVSFCNRFYLSEEITAHILATFSDFHRRVNSPWGLLCGLTAIAFSEINRTLMQNRIGYKSKLYQNLQVLQRGGLRTDEITEWVKIAQHLCSQEPWIKELKLRRETEYPKGIASLTSFLTPSVCYHSPEMDRSYRRWINSIQETS